jgi:UDP-N-acetylmuramate--alanine ligase
MHIYFSGLGGSGLTPLANLALDCGYKVSGSDREMSQNLIELQKRGVQFSLEQSTSEIQAIHDQDPIDWIIHTSALPDLHPHLLFASNNRIRITKRHDLINSILEAKNLKLIAISGTHGKTTTTGMLIWIFKQLEIPVSYLVGSSISYGNSGEYNSGSEYFVYECDEFDRNFLNFKPFLSIIPSLDYDHPDTYPTKKTMLRTSLNSSPNPKMF